MAVFIFSDQYLPTFPFLEVPLYNELVDRGLDTYYVLQDGDIRLTQPHLYPNFHALNLHTIKKAKDICDLIKPNDVLVSRFDYKRMASSVATKARSVGATVLMYDPSGIDIRVRKCPAHYIAVKSEKMKDDVVKKFGKAYKNIFITGTIHYDGEVTTDVDRDEFMMSYGLDPKKKLAILTPANPGELGHQKGIDKDYKKIVSIVKSQCPGYELVVKAHPMDYLAELPAQPGVVHKNEHYNGKFSWRIYAPDTPVIKAEEGYMALKACDVIVNIRSSLAMETAMFKKPLVNVDRNRYTTNWPFMNGVMKDIKMDELASTLNKNKYGVDIDACKKYIKQECYSDDGKAYVRMADVIKGLV